MGEQFKIIEYPLILLFIVSGAIFLVSTSDLVSIFLLFIYIAHEWLRLANTLALILFNLYMTSTTFFSTVYTGILLKFNTVLSIFPSIQTGSLSKSDCYFFFLYLFAYFWTRVMDIQFRKVGRETRSDGTFVRDVYSIWDLNDSNCMLWLLPPGSYLMVEGAAWHPLIHAYVDRRMLYPIRYFTFVHRPLILPGLPPLTPVMLDIPVSLHTLTWYFFLPFFLIFKLIMVYPYDGILI